MRDGLGRFFPYLLVMVIALAVFVPTLNWGLPTRETDRYLFGDRKPWTGAEILALLGENDLPLPLAGGGRGVGQRNSDSQSIASDQSTDPLPGPPPRAGAGARGADVDADPILDRSQPVVLNDTDRKRAAIVQRYRLMSGQPDEFIQFKALAEMNGRTGLARFDPRLYQYGGLWIYPVGALVKTSMLVGLIESPPPGTNAKAFYLDRPDVFGKFYVVARGYSTFWGVVAALAIAWIAKRSTGNPWLGVVAAVCFIALPVTRTAAHEAKPHLAGAALCLCAVIAGTKYVETNRRRWLFLAGGLCGASMGMVVSMLLSMVIVPTAWWLARKNPLPRTRGRGQGEGESARPIQVTDELPTRTPSPQPSPPNTGARGPSFGLLVSGLAAAAFVYTITNPFVIYNALAHPEILRSNLGNSTAMYESGFGVENAVSAIRIASHSMSLLGLIVFLMAVVLVLIHQKRWSLSSGLNQLAWVDILLVFTAILFAVQFIVMSASKPAEYGRFGLVLFATASVVIARAIGIVSQPQVRLSTFVVILFLFIGASYLSLLKLIAINQAKFRGSYIRIIQGQTAESGAALQRLQIGLEYEPAPWSAPPIDLFHNSIVLYKTLSTNLKDYGALQLDFYVRPTNLLPGDSFLSDLQSVDWCDNTFRIIPVRWKPATRPSPT